VAKEKKKLGLLSIKERIESIGGRVVIQAGTDQGCSIQVTIPHGTGRIQDG
jgi:signal transduction histidine kinase